MSETWKVATPVERNAIARELFFDVVIDNRAVVAVKPRPELVPFFQQIPGLAGNDCQFITQGRKRRGTVTHLRYNFDYLYASSELRETLMQLALSTVTRRPSPLSPDAIAEVRKLASEGAPLRAIAAMVGVSHETVRAYLVA